MPPDLDAFLATLARVLPSFPAEEARSVHRYAWSGLGGAETRACVERLLEALYIPAASRQDIMAVHVRGAENDPLHRTMLAARGRRRLADHDEILPVELAALSGYTRGYIRQLTAEGNFPRVADHRRSRAPFASPAPISLLAQRGVPGYTSAVASADRSAMGRGRYGNDGIDEGGERAPAKAGEDPGAAGGAARRAGMPGRRGKGPARKR